jgi:hypothetical protein
MDNLYDLKNSLFRRGTGSELRSPTQWGPYGSREALVQRATSQRVGVEFPFRVGRRRCIGPKPGLRLAVRYAKGKAERKEIVR